MIRYVLSSRFELFNNKTQSRGLAMTVNTQRPNFLRPAPSPVTGQRLYLREDELDAGLAMILEAGHAIKARTLAQRQKHDLNWTQARALTAVLQAPQGVLHLSVRLDITKQSAIKTIEELEHRALVVRGNDPRDGRRRTISLTADGEAIARELSAAMRTLLAKAYRQAGGDAVAGCDAVLNAIKSGGAKT
jgi:DNA-binding MarR family transcriptional regulator